MLRSASLRIVLGISLLTTACGPGGGSLDTGSSSGGTMTAGETGATGPGATTASSTSPTAADTSDDTATGGGEVMEYEGFYSSGFGFAYFAACGESEEWYAENVPVYEACASSPLYLRVRGMMLPPYEGESTPRLAVVEILEGPCTGGRCDGSVPVDECASFDALCEVELVLECDLVAQDCPVGERCVPWANDGGMAWNATRCSDVAPMPGAPGEPCQAEGNPYSGLDDCALGAVCWDADPGTGQGVCVAICDQTLTPDRACAAGTSCMSIFAEVDPAGVCL